MKFDIKLLENKLKEMLLWGNIEDLNLYISMFKRLYKRDFFKNEEIDPIIMLENYLKYNLKVITKDDKDFKKILSIYKKEGLTEVVWEKFEQYDYFFIEAVDNEDNPTKFLMSI